MSYGGSSHEDTNSEARAHGSFASMGAGSDDAGSGDGDDDYNNGVNTSGLSSGGPSGGPKHKKRPRRRYDEIERMYDCKFPGCNKSYGTLNHLNAHVAMQKHGAKRLPGEFKDMRKAWRKAKREEEQRRMAQAQQAVSAHAHAQAAQAAAAAEHERARMAQLFAAGMPPPPVPHMQAGLPAGQAYAPLPAQGMSYSARPSVMAPPQAGAGAVPSHAAYMAGTSVGAAAAGGPDFDYRTHVPAQPGGLGAYLMTHRGSI